MAFPPAVETLPLDEHQRLDLTEEFGLPAIATLDDRFTSFRYRRRLKVTTSLPQKGIGLFDKLPIELLLETIAQLDLRAVAKFRSLNKLANQFVLSIPKFQVVRSQARQLLGAMSRVGTDRFFTFETLYNKLCSAECEECGDFGTYLNLINCKRVCYLCCRDRRSFLPLRSSHVRGQYGLNKRNINAVPHMETIKRHYGEDRYTMRRAIGAGVKLYDRESVRKAALAQFGSIADMEEFVDEMNSRKSSDWERRKSNRTDRVIHCPPDYDPEKSWSLNDLRFAAVMSQPWYNRDPKRSEWGIRCKACLNPYFSPGRWDDEGRDRVFTVHGLDEHLKECGMAEDGEHVILSKRTFKSRRID